MNLVARTKVESQVFGGLEPGFHGNIDVRYLDGVYWQLLEEFIYCSPLLQTCIRIPAGTKSNFASIPKAMWWWMSPVDAHIAAAALVHDELYHKPIYLVTKKEADQVLREGMGFLNATAFEMWGVYRFIRPFGSNFSPRTLPNLPDVRQVA